MAGLVAGILVVIGVMVYSIEGEYESLMQMHSIVIVFGGTVGVFLLMATHSLYKDVFANLRGMFKGEQVFATYKQELIELSKNKAKKVDSSHPLIAYASELWEQGVDSDLFVGLLAQKKEELETKDMAAILGFKNLAKYPPTLGMMGTVMGMIALFSTLDSGKGNIGTNLAIAMTATLFGLLLSNLVLAPIADRLSLQHYKMKRMSKSIFHILLLINDGEASAIIANQVEDHAA